jgi:hypothetical protein
VPAEVETPRLGGCSAGPAVHIAATIPEVGSEVWVLEGGAVRQVLRRMSSPFGGHNPTLQNCQSLVEPLRRCTVLRKCVAAAFNKQLASGRSGPTERRLCAPCRNQGCSLCRHRGSATGSQSMTCSTLRSQAESWCARRRLLQSSTRRHPPGRTATALMRRSPVPRESRKQTEVWDQQGAHRASRIRPANQPSN